MTDVAQLIADLEGYVTWFNGRNRNMRQAHGTFKAGAFVAWKGPRQASIANQPHPKVGPSAWTRLKD
eukprot:6127158-Pleurochrysis_carterae.AAC.2